MPTEKKNPSSSSIQRGKKWAVGGLQLPTPSIHQDETDFRLKETEVIVSSPLFISASYTMINILGLLAEICCNVSNDFFACTRTQQAPRAFVTKPS